MLLLIVLSIASALVVAGIAMWSIPAGLIAAGVLTAALAFLFHDPKREIEALEVDR